MIPIVAASALAHFILWMGSVAGVAILIVFFVAKFPIGGKKQSALTLANAALDARAAKIDAQLKLAEQSREEARKAHEESQAEIAKAHEEASQIVDRAKGMTESLRSELQSEAAEEKERIIAQARSVIDAERNRAVLELRASAADAAVAAARDIVRQTMDESTDKAIIDRALNNSNGGGHA